MYEDPFDAFEDLLEIPRGRTFKEYWAIDLPDGTTLNPIPVVTYAKLSVRDKHAGTELMMLDTTNGGIVLQYTEEPGDNGLPSGFFWSGYYYMAHPATAQLPDWGLAVWDMYVQYDNSEKDTLFKGRAVLMKEVGT